MSDERINCEEVIEQLFAFLDREISDEDSVRIERHLARCRDCYTRAEFEKKLREKIAAAAAEEAPERLRRRVRALFDKF